MMYLYKHISSLILTRSLYFRSISAWPARYRLRDVDIRHRDHSRSSSASSRYEGPSSDPQAEPGNNLLCDVACNQGSALRHGHGSIRLRYYRPSKNRSCGRLVKANIVEDKKFALRTNITCVRDAGAGQIIDRPFGLRCEGLSSNLLE